MKVSKVREHKRCASGQGDPVRGGEDTVGTGTTEEEARSRVGQNQPK